MHVNNCTDECHESETILDCSTKPVQIRELTHNSIFTRGKNESYTLNEEEI